VKALGLPTRELVVDRGKRWMNFGLIVFMKSRFSEAMADLYGSNLQIDT